MQLIEEYIKNYSVELKDNKVVIFPSESFVFLCKRNDVKKIPSDRYLLDYEIIKVDIAPNQEGHPCFFKVYIYNPIKNFVNSNYVSNNIGFWNMHYLFWSKNVLWEEWDEFINSFLSNSDRKIILDPLELKKTFIDIFFSVAEKYIADYATTVNLLNFKNIFSNDNEICKWSIKEFESYLECSVMTILPGLYNQFVTNYSLNYGPPSWLKNNF